MSLTEENAEALADIAARGTDLTIRRKVDFAHRLYSEANASGFKHAAEKAGYTVRVEVLPSSDLSDGGGVWDVTASLEMVPVVEDLTLHEEVLGGLVQKFDGHSDGWGFESS
ncbi:ribonuclease E inhibitor RraB [Sphingomonas ginkgonis]|uniref:Ribonuclease E inhibitor RraB n=1 Tax=Sphingomonas ginkgonis TaxID=2315330 RepID=A0A3R9YP19_9SPHN|nr:ribonuclease E inhibitor RraB [Sphingomonas ginkgonis]RST31862.1 ribonuclease E inhibitor RraB [Sphingomonas ginkgonis]